jgi:hypothetical protein
VVVITRATSNPHVLGENAIVRYGRHGDIYLAIFLWQEAGIECSRSFSIEQLEIQILKCKARGEPSRQLEAALWTLRRMNA